MNKRTSVLMVSLVMLIMVLAGCTTAPQDGTSEQGPQPTLAAQGDNNEITPTPVDGESNLQVFGEYDAAEIEAESVPLGFLAKPKDEGIFPGIVMIHEWWGLNDNIKEMAKHLAAEGYVVLAIDLYDGQVAQSADEARTLTSSVRNNQSAATEKLKAAVRYLKEEQDVSRVASMGWCFGGGQSLQLALSGEILDATVIYYGQLTNDSQQLAIIEWPVMGVFGADDTSIPVSSVNSFSQALDDLGVAHNITVYQGVGHAFANPSGQSFAPQQTRNAWENTIAFLNQNLKG